MFKVHMIEQKTLRWWCSQQDKIDMEPPYQRQGKLWSKTDKAFLIDSILNEYDIPKIYMADFTFGTSPLNRKRLPYAIIDGKQRLEAMFDFFNGKLTLDSTFVYESDPNIKIGGLGYPDLKKNHPDIADIFDNYNLSVMRVLTDDENKINELFVRLNRSKPLTGAEIRNAMAGPVPQSTRLVTDHKLFKDFIHFTISRGQDKNAAAKVLLFEFKQQLMETKRKNLDSFVTVTLKKDQKDIVELASRRVLDTLDRMAEIFLPKDPLLASAGILPVYYWFVRQRDSKEDSVIREFLNDFEQKRKANRSERKSSRQIPEDNDLVEFDTYNRSTNDERSYNGRIEILNKRFDRYLKTAK
jgi:hypothetical protein